MTYFHALLNENACINEGCEEEMKRNINLIKILVIALSLSSLARATTWYVHPDSTLNSIQAGINYCHAHDTVLVGPSIYYENIVWPNTQGIILVSELGSDSTIIDGQQSGTAITISVDIDTVTVIRGFTVQNGLYEYDGGGISLSGASPKIENNVVQYNAAEFGGGISVESGAPIIQNNSIIHNSGLSSCGGIFCDWSDAIIRNNTISYNSCPGHGAGIYFIKSALLIDNNQITHNSAGMTGGALCWYLSSPTIINNTIENNSADKGGGIYSQGDGTIKFNTICENTATEGGGLYSLAGPDLIRSNTIVTNSADRGGGIYCGSSSTIIFNILCGNSATDLGGGVFCTSSSPAINCNNIHGNTNYGIYNEVSSVIIDAEWNWWGDPTGPYHSTTNPNGLGDWVSDYVDYDPWLDEPFGIEEETTQNILTHLQISPNPFSMLTKIRFGTGGTKSIALAIYDVSGRLVKQFNHLSTQLPQERGFSPQGGGTFNRVITWSGDDNDGVDVPNGVYFLKFTVSSGGKNAVDRTESRKLILIR